MTDDRRELILAELGLLPLWVPRDRARPAPQRVDPPSEKEQPPARVAEPEDRAARIIGSAWPELKEMVRACTD